MKTTIHPTIIYRVPKFSYTADLAESWEALKASIAAGTDSFFYSQIKDIGVTDLNDLAPKMAHTVWKYFNRARYRATPSGTFASIGTFRMKSSNKAPLTISSEQQVHELTDWSHQPDVAHALHQHLLVFSNSSFYYTPESIRYIGNTEDGYSIMSNRKDHELLNEILRLCQIPIPVLALKAQIDPAVCDEDFYELLEIMLDLQLLLTSNAPNIIGEDYFERIGITTQPEHPKYLIAEQAYSAGSLPPGLLDHVPKLMSMLQKLQPATEPEPLANFKKRFLKRFEGLEIPLMEALDPEMGIGYDDLEQPGDVDDFTLQFNRGKKKVTDPIEQFMKGLIGFKTLGGVVQLDELVIPASENSSPLPNTFSLLFNTADELLCVESMGGCTANALLGRFTMVNEDIYNTCTAMAQIEADANPEVLFFDIAYLAGDQIDNVNRRKSIYEYQLSILNYDTSFAPLSLRDLMISMVGDELMIRSRRLNKRLIPRMASAYNYTRSDLSVFRLLSDLQSQGIQAGPGISLKRKWPGLDYYPRLQFKNIVLSPASWTIKKSDVCDSVPADRIAYCRLYLQSRSVSQYFRTGQGDMKLTFDLWNNQDIMAFLFFIQKYDEIEIEEVIPERHPAVQDGSGNPYKAQFIVNLVHHETIYKGLGTIPAAYHNRDVEQLYPPGSEWLYFEIHCHPQRADGILQEYVSAFLEKHSSHILQWFFIRYSEQGNHIRLRIHSTSFRAQVMIQSLSLMLRPLLDGGIISDLQIKTYKRELQRYTPELMELVEAHFHLDSIFVLSILSLYSVAERYKIVAMLFNRIRTSGAFTKEEFNTGIHSISDAFNREHYLDNKDFKQLNSRFQDFRNDVKLNFHSKAFDLFCNSFIQLLSLSASQKMSLFGDLMHMHINRLFKDRQRSHEMVCYYFMVKDLKMREALKRIE